MDTDLLEPRSAYQHIYKDKHHENTIKYFDDLVKKANTDIEGNRQTVKQYREVLKQLESLNGKLAGKKGLKTFLIILTVISFIAGAIFVLLGVNETLPLWAGILACVGCVGLAVGFIVIIAKVINGALKRLKEEIAKLEKERDRLLAEAWAQMATLNKLFDWNIPAQIMNMDTDLIKMDKHFDGDKYVYLHDKFGLDDNTNPHSSCVLVQSGEMLGNPFLLCRDYRQSWYNHEYTGTLTIHWTTTYTDKNGTHTQHHTQTLVAHVYKPAPSYNYTTYLVYGNEACPKLSFSRSPSGATGLDEKKINKMVTKGAKELDDKARKALKKGEDYTRFGNDEFEVLFGGTDRDNELEYRMMFTTLAQKNLLSLIKEKEPFGDDFYFDKSKMLNFIQTNHSQSFDYRADPDTFVGYEYDAVREFFISYNDNYFKNFFFELAPVLSVPLYQQTKTREYIYNNEYRPNMSTYEDEVIANKFNKKDLLEPSSITDAIIKADHVGKIGNADKVRLTAHSFTGITRVELVPMRGGDGRMHNVPVEWIEYIPVQKETYMAIEKKNSTRADYITQQQNDAFKTVLAGLALSSQYRYERGLFGVLLAHDITDGDLSSVNNVFKEGNVAEVVRDSLTKGIKEEIEEVQDAIKEAQNQTDGNIQK